MLIRQRFVTQKEIPASGLIKLVSEASGINGAPDERTCRALFPEQGMSEWPYVIISSGSPNEFAIAYDPRGRREFKLQDDKSNCFIVVADEGLLTPKITGKLLSAVAVYVGRTEISDSATH